MDSAYLVYGSKNSGSVSVEAALTLAGAPFRIEERNLWEDPAAPAALAKVNPQRQLPAVILPGGQTMTESAAILLQIAEAHPEARLAPPPGSALRPAFLRWMVFVSTQIYAHYWLRDEPSRVTDNPAGQTDIETGLDVRILENWRTMDAGLAPAGPYLFGQQVSVLDIYIAVTSCWRPRRRAFREVAPGLARVVARLDDHPKLKTIWETRLDIEPGWSA